MKIAILGMVLVATMGCSTLKGFGSAVTATGTTVKEESQGLLADVITAVNTILTAGPNYVVGLLGADEE